ncbi:hypothetical protein SAE02_17550 [Skermanella aerolata]|uniref:DUF4384 domain-containing protein n=2 Tax=Skermanella aerolata TaxID=393310 RepID=A0A512DMA9_9PROT|nr:hypothetical protein N826_32060 [Skermanella aerolata KACC 11604]GEO37607.1 hypothetical protein SAE02_17550 [Skermanella aerolata]
MAMLRMTSVQEENPGGAEEIFNAVLVSAMAGYGAMAVTAAHDDDATTLVRTVGTRMDAAGAVVMIALAHPGASLLDLIDQVGLTSRPKVIPIAASKAKAKKHRSDDLPSPESLALTLLQGEDAGLLIVAEAHALDQETLEDLLSLSQVHLGDSRALQVLLAGNDDLNANLDRSAGQVRVKRWTLDLCAQPAAQKAIPAPTPQPQPIPVQPPSPTPSQAPPPADRRPRHRQAAFGLLLTAAAATGWFAADRALTEYAVAVSEPPVIEAPLAEASPQPEPEPAPAPIEPQAAIPSPEPPPEILLSTDHGPMPTLNPGDTIVVQVESNADRFVYCYYMDSFRQVSRIFPNRFQTDAFVPAGQQVAIPPGPEAERPFNIRLDMASRLEVITCLASSTAIDGSGIDGTDIDDLTPIPGLGLQDIFDAFGKLAGTGACSQTMPINVVAKVADQ